jgi:hypothetical protein
MALKVLLRRACLCPCQRPIQIIVAEIITANVKVERYGVEAVGKLASIDVSEVMIEHRTCACFL